MTFFRDLSPFRYAGPPQLYSAVNIGWLSPLRYCPFGWTTPEFRDKLFELCAEPQVRHGGCHPCLLGLCIFRPRPFGITAFLNGRDAYLGCGLIVVRGTADMYVAPNLIYHYVTRHGYRPPKGFIDAVLSTESPPNRPSSSGYSRDPIERAIERFKRQLEDDERRTLMVREDGKGEEPEL